MRLLRLSAALLVALVLATPASSQSAQPPKPAPQDEYVPLDQLPPQAELPAAPMVIAAYTFVWIAFVGYMFLLVKRVTRVEADLRDLEQRANVASRR
jgi:CcmD family protein